MGSNERETKLHHVHKFQVAIPLLRCNILCMLSLLLIVCIARCFLLIVEKLGETPLISSCNPNLFLENFRI